MAKPLLQVENLAKHFGGVRATDNLSLEVRGGEIHALIGPNGAGKTTLISQLIGETVPDAGIIRFQGEIINSLPVPARVARGLARTFQITQLLRDETALANVALAIQVREGHSFHFLANARREAALLDPAKRILDHVGLGARACVIVSELSHGENKQLELALALATQPKLLLLDEPMAGLGAAESQEMTTTLKALKGNIPMLLVEHDMEAVFALADRISVLVYGRVIATGTAAEIQANADVRTAYLGESDA